MVSLNNMNFKELTGEYKTQSDEYEKRTGKTTEPLNTSWTPARIRSEIEKIRAFIEEPQGNSFAEATTEGGEGEAGEADTNAQQRPPSPTQWTDLAQERPSLFANAVAKAEETDTIRAAAEDTRKARLAAEEALQEALEKEREQVELLRKLMAEVEEEEKAHASHANADADIDANASTRAGDATMSVGPQSSEAEADPLGTRGTDAQPQRMQRGSSFLGKPPSLSLKSGMGLSLANLSVRRGTAFIRSPSGK